MRSYVLCQHKIEVTLNPVREERPFAIGKECNLCGETTKGGEGEKDAICQMLQTMHNTRLDLTHAATVSLCTPERKTEEGKKT